MVWDRRLPQAPQLLQSLYCTFLKLPRLLCWTRPARAKWAMQMLSDRQLYGNTTVRHPHLLNRRPQISRPQIGTHAPEARRLHGILHALHGELTKAAWTWLCARIEKIATSSASRRLWPACADLASALRPQSSWGQSPQRLGPSCKRRLTAEATEGHGLEACATIANLAIRQSSTPPCLVSALRTKRSHARAQTNHTI